LNENSQILGKEFLDKYMPEEITGIQLPQPPKPTIVQNTENQLSDFEQCEVIRRNIDKSESFVNGNRNHYCGLLCAGLNRIGIDNNTAYNYLVQFEQPDFTAVEIHKIVLHTYKHTNLHGCNPITNLKIQNKSIAPKPIETPFPMDGMPTVLSDLINDSVKVYASPLEYFACTLLVACGSVVRKNAVVDDGKFKNYPQLWLMYIGSSGIGKDMPLKIAFKPIYELDKISHELYIKEMIEWKSAVAIAKKEKTDLPAMPTLKMILIDDATPESLYPCLQQNGGLTLLRDELSGWFADFGRYAKSGEIQRYLSMFTNGTFTVTRVSKEHLRISDPFYSITGGIQPEILPATLNENQLKENGFAQRILFAFPDVAIQPYYSEAIPNPAFAVRYNKLIQHLHSVKFGTLTLSAEAKKLYVEFVNEMVAERNNTIIPYRQAFYSRFRMHVLRISLVLELIKTYPNGLNSDKTISFETMKYAIDICRYFIACGLKVEKLVNQQNDNSKTDIKGFAKQLLEKGVTQMEVARLTELSQSTISRLSKSE
jgi:hypothetical protein